MEEILPASPAVMPDGPAFGPARWRGWSIAGITLLSVAALYIVQIIIGIVVAAFTIVPYIRMHPGVVPDVNTLLKEMFNAPSLFAMVIPSEALMAFLAVVLVASSVGANRSNLGIGRRIRALDIAQGFVAGLLLVGASFFVAFIQDKIFGPHPQESVKIIMSHHGLGSFALDFVTVALAAGICEEIVFRGVVFAALVQRLPVWLAAASSGLIFAAAHIDRWSLLALWTVGVGLGLLYYRTRSLWPNMVAHTTFNAFTLVIVYYFPQFAR